MKVLSVKVIIHPTSRAGSTQSTRQEGGIEMPDLYSQVSLAMASIAS